MTTIDLATRFPGEAGIPQESDIAVFTTSAEGPRVIAETHLYIVYSSKNRNHLRFITRSNNAQTNIKLHQSDVVAVSFVNYKSNVVASAGVGGEFLVWFVQQKEEKLEASLYLRLTDLKVGVRSFSWFIDPLTKAPDIIMTFGTTCAVLNSAKVIAEYKGVAMDYAVSNCKPFKQSISAGQSFTTVGPEGLFAFNADSSSVVTCTALRPNTPAWKPIGASESLVGLVFLQGKPILLAASERAVYLWNVAAEPVLIAKLVVVAGVCCIAAVANSFVIATNDKIVYTAEVPPEGGLICENFQCSRQFSAKSISTTMHTPHTFMISGDFGEKLALTILKRSAPVELLPPSSTLFGTPVISPPEAIASGSPPPPKYTVLNVNVAPPNFGRSLINPALPQLSSTDGAIAMTLEESMREFQAAKARVDSALQNTSQVLNLVAPNVRKDHVALTSLSLEAQMTELQHIGVGQISPAQNNSAVDAQFVKTLLDEVAMKIVDGLVPGVQSALLNDFEPGLRTAIVNKWKKTNKDAFKLQVNAVIKDCAVVFTQELETKQKAYEKNLEHYAKEVKKLAEGAIQKLSNQVCILEDQLNAITNSRLLEEVKELRREVKELRSAAVNQQVSSDLAPTTVVANAKQMILSGSASRGLEYIVRIKNPELTLTLLCELDSEPTVEGESSVRSKLCENASIPDKTWEEVLMHCALATKLARLAPALSWMRDVVTERDSLLQSAPLKSALQTFAASWKPHVANDATLLKAVRTMHLIVN